MGYHCLEHLNGKYFAGIVLIHIHPVGIAEYPYGAKQAGKKRPYENNQ